MKIETQNSKQEEIASQSNESSDERWNLSDVLPARSGKLFQVELLERLESQLVEFEASRAELETISPDRFMLLLQDYEQIVRLRVRLGTYAYMFFSEDIRSQEARSFKSRAEETDADAANRTLFFELWWKSLDESKTKELIGHSKKYEYFLKRLIQTKPYTLAETVEQAINLKDVTGKTTLLQIYHQVRDSFTYEVIMAEIKQKLREEQVRDLFHSPDRNERKASYSSMLAKFQQNSDVLGEIYKALVRDWRNEGLKLRKYRSPISIRNVANDVPDEAVDALLAACKENAMVFHRFFKIKSKILNIDDYSRFDVYSPMPTVREKAYTWEEGMKLVLQTFESFDSDFASLARNVLSTHHFDWQVREGKLGGAYCMSVTPELTPYILLSYTGKPRSVATLAHELGHSIHSQLSGRRNSQLTFEASLPLAETASVFGELLLTDKLMSEASEDSRRSLLLEMLNDSYGTILRQSFFVLFERQAHEAISGGATVEELSLLYLKNLREQFSDSLEVPDEFKNEWLSIPHIYQTPFYCYAYSWGNLLVLALYKQFREEGAKPFVPRYLKILSYGGSEAPEKILNEAGFDIRSRNFWQSGFDELKRAVDDLEHLVT
ncbi:MAG: M3 family oligoendopeptidase [Nitrososphaerales archaeon]